MTDPVWLPCPFCGQTPVRTEPRDWQQWVHPGAKLVGEVLVRCVLDEKVLSLRDREMWNMRESVTA